MKFKIRYFLEKDFKDYQELANEPEIAEMAGMRILTTPFEQWMAFKGMVGRQGFFAITDEADHVVGGIYFFNQAEANHYELGYLLKQKYWNQGIMSKAVYFAIKAIQKQNSGKITISASVLADNIASTRVLMKNNFQRLNGVVKSTSAYDGRLRSEVEFELIVKGVE